MMRQFLHWPLLICLILLCLPFGVLAQDSVEPKHARHDAWIELYTAPCIHEPPGVNAGTLLYKGATSMTLLYKPPTQQTGKTVVVASVGRAVTPDKDTCEESEPKQFPVTIDDPQQLSTKTVSTVFTVLVTVLAIAILLESAFELLFNWRVFQEYFVGKAWRTPIMFAISLMLVLEFKIEVLAPVYDAYRNRPSGTTDEGLLTQILTAMILAGGSVGVNRIMRKLGIRSPFPKVEEERPQLTDKQAYLSVTVKKKGQAAKFFVNLYDEPLDPSVPAILGATGAPRGLGTLLFPNSARLPRSGGLTIPVDKTYRLTVTDLETNTEFDITGVKVTQDKPERIRFAPRAFVDLVIELR